MRAGIITPLERVDTDSYEAVLREMEAQGAVTELLTPGGRPAEGDEGIVLSPEGSIQAIDLEEYDLFVVVGTDGDRCQFEDPTVTQFFVEVLDREVPLVAVCDAVTMLAETGALTEMTVAACHTDVQRVESLVGGVADGPYSRCGSLVTVCADVALEDALHAAIDLTAR